MKGHRTAGLDQLGPVHHTSRFTVFTDSPQKKGYRWSIGSRAATSTKRRKVKVTLAVRA